MGVNTNPNKSFFNKSFKYKTNRWEEWENGQCISKGNISLIISAVAIASEIEFAIEGEIGNLNIKRVSRFQSSYLSEDKEHIDLFPRFTKRLIPGRISYNAKYVNDVFNEQFIVELHFENQLLSYIRFCFQGRIIEFYGEVIVPPSN